MALVMGEGIHIGNFMSSRLKIGRVCLEGPYGRGKGKPMATLARERVHIGR